MSEPRSQRYPFAVALLVFAALCMSGSGATAADPDAIERGKRLFSLYCSNCHGQSAKGDGPTAELLTVKPADLTRIAESNDGMFPLEKVHEAIDGRRRISGHGMTQMPIWGLAFQELDLDTNQEEEVRRRIRQLLEYIESIQVTEKP